MVNTFVAGHMPFSHMEIFQTLDLTAFEAKFTRPVSVSHLSQLPAQGLGTIHVLVMPCGKATHNKQTLFFVGYALS
jgi:hypothetical protein